MSGGKRTVAKYISAEEAVALVESGTRVFIQGGACTPLHLVNKLLERNEQLRQVELISISTYGDINWQHPGVLQSFYLNSLFVSSNLREWVNGANGDYLPVFLSEIPRLFDQHILPIDTAIIQVSTPDEFGYCTLGPSVDITASAVKHAKRVIAQVNPLMPRVFGDGIFHLSNFDAVVWHESELAMVSFGEEMNMVHEKIGSHIASIVDDGSTLQLGIGAIPNAVLRSLSGHKNLGLHTEMFSDGVVPLVEKGIITNQQKKLNTGKSVSSFVLGTRKVYDFINNNPTVSCLDVAYVNDADIIKQNPKVVAINSAIEIDLTGQVCADSIGTLQYSGIGGQMDFMRGASLSEGGKPIIALPSTTHNGTSRIVPFLKQGAGVVTTRGHIHYVVTEYGCVNLYGRNMSQRAKLLISIAHPSHRETLEQACYTRFGKAAL